MTEPTPVTQSARSETAATHLAFDGWTLDSATGDLWKAGQHQRLQEQPLKILVELLRRPGELVTREQLIACLWPTGVVDFDTSLNTAVRKLRAALGDDAAQPRYIETLPRKGYRFIGRLEDAPAARPQSRRALWTSAAALVMAAVIASLWTFTRPPAAARAAAVPLAQELYLAARARQPNISVNEGPARREQVLDLLNKALALDPGLAPAYVVRARTNLDSFISNVDVSEGLLSSVQADLATARRLSGDATLGTDVEALYVGLTDLDPERALALTEGASQQPEVLRTRATLFAGIGRFRESDEIFDRLLALDPADERLLRIKMTNLLAERRDAEAIGVIRTLTRQSPPGRMATNFGYSVTGNTEMPRPSFSEVETALTRPDPDDETLVQSLTELELMRVEHRYDEIRQLLERVQVESFRILPFTAALPGLGRQPVALMRGWNALLMNDPAAATRAGDDTRAWLSRQQANRWNAWVLRMFEAQAQLFLGERATAAQLAREALQQPTPQYVNLHVQLYREYLAALTFAWAGDTEAALALIQKISSGAPSVRPVFITRDPLVFTPVQGNARFENLRRALESDIAASARL
jgi:DNA-binding winged helix-turn-helix (wHTH) protein